jgi:peptidyl-prolyl cis-trans isomerase A (cyclophilin A)
VGPLAEEVQIELGQHLAIAIRIGEVARLPPLVHPQAIVELVRLSVERHRDLEQAALVPPHFDRQGARARREQLDPLRRRLHRSNRHHRTAALAPGVRSEDRKRVVAGAGRHRGGGVGEDRRAGHGRNCTVARWYPLAFIHAEPAHKEPTLPGVYAQFVTTEGNFTVKLFDQEAPRTVENFVGLAEGTKEWTDPRTNQKVRAPYYNGVIFHRVIDGFMVQSGDPLGQGIGGPGYNFADEFHPKLRHDKPGILSMANRGPNTNGGQFFITLGPTPHLDDRHSVFGEVVEGMDVVRIIGRAKTGDRDRPAKDIVIETITIERR